jgi:ATP-dependent RNA helicase DDX19/DBP5
MNPNNNINIDTKTVEKINADVDKLTISLDSDLKQEIAASNQFEEIEKLNQELVDDECDKPIATNVGEDGPENLVKDVNELIAKDTWETLGVTEKIREGLIEMNFIRPSKIQASTYPLIMKKPFSHLIAQSHNGSGKTGAFGLGTLSRLDESENSIQAVILAHTRELVNQIVEVLSKMAKYTSLKITALDKTNKKSEVGHVVVTTPGTFDTTFLQRKMYDLKHLRVLVLDEADYMLSNENTQNVCERTFKYFVNNNLQVQVLFFSATFIDDHFRYIKKFFKKAHIIEMKKESLTLKNVRQMYFQCHRRDEKVAMVEEYLKRSIENERIIIFVNTREFTIKLQQILKGKGYRVFILMGGDMLPQERDETIKKFNKGEIQILITTNVLARGFDEKLVKLIINFDLPVKQIGTGNYGPDYETYLHRIGRTGRFGTKGIGFTLISDEKELKMLKEIENYYGSNIEEIKSLDTLMEEFKRIIEEKF